MAPAITETPGLDIGFVERAGDVHIGRNESTTTPREIYATYFNVPVGGSVVIDAPDPGTCPF